jgi:hypothetical protein
MAATLSTVDPNGLGFQRGLFSATPGTPINQAFFDAAFAGHINGNKIYKNAYYCNIVQQSTMFQWLDEYMGYETDCHPKYSLIENYSDRHLIKTQGSNIIDNYPNTSVIELDPSAAYTSNAYLLPQVGNTIVLPNGELVKVTALGVASAADPKITVQPRNPNFTDYTIPNGTELIVFSGSEIADCACPTGQFAVPEAPIVTDLEMYHFGDKGDVCGDAVDKCQWLKIPFYDECGNVVEQWYTDALQKMYKRFEKSKNMERLLNPNWGLIPVLKARGIKWTPNDPNTIVEQDFRTWAQELDKAGIGCTEFSIFAGRNLYSKFSSAFNSLAKSNLQYSERPLMDCAWINLEYCGIKVEGLTLHVYKEPMFSSGKELGGVNYVYPDSAIIVPMCQRPACTRSNGRQDSGGNDNKMLSMVYFKSQATGEVFDNKLDSNGIFGPRNTFGAGCRQHEWTIECRALQEIHCPNWWGYMGLS